MTVTDIAEARRRRDERREHIRQATRWAFEIMPWRCTITSDEFVSRWHDLTSSERYEVAQTVDRMTHEFQAAAVAPALDYDDLMSRLAGREKWWNHVASWSYLQGPHPDYESADFIDHFSQISRSELLMGIIHARRIRNVMK
ncbi:MAG: hypothetical protein J0H88_13805 [Sphingomonadales bacterium]|nr:hypothetical protein [Sphingomonadales bacterium]